MSNPLFISSVSENLINAFKFSDGFARIIVLLLFFLSVYAWSIMVNKGLMLLQIRRNSNKFLTSFRKAVSPLDLALIIERYKGPMVRLYQVGLEEVMEVLNVNPQLIDQYCRSRKLPRPLTMHEIDKVRTALERNVTNEINELESRLGLLGTVVTVSPFLGLLGTVWGVMMAFCGMAIAGRPDIKAMAPGVAGALLTTVVGLIVAIPSVVGFNLIANSVRQTTAEMDNFVDDFVVFLKLQVTTKPTKGE